jgi:SAM-dependent methyltransferase
VSNDQSTAKRTAEGSIPAAIWETAGATEHLGGFHATGRLIRLCHVTAGQTVVDLGCGTGHTASLLAREHRVRVIALDIGARSVAEARTRLRGYGPGERPALLRGDAQRIPLCDAVADAVISESVLVFCRAAQVATEIYRVLKPGGMWGANEFTLLQAAPRELEHLLLDTLGIQPLEEEGWKSIWSGAGFTDLDSTVQRMSLREQFLSHLQVDGLRGYLRSMAQGLSDARIYRTFINRSILRAARQFMPIIGYGLYSGRKPQ